MELFLDPATTAEQAIVGCGGSLERTPTQALHDLRSSEANAHEIQASDLEYALPNFVDTTPNDLEAEDDVTFNDREDMDHDSKYGHKLDDESRRLFALELWKLEEVNGDFDSWKIRYMDT